MTRDALFVMFARSRGLSTFAALAAATALICLTAPTGLVATPFADVTAVHVLRCACAAGAAGWALCVASPLRDLEAALPPGGLRWLRLAWFATGSLLLAGTAVVAVTAQGADHAVRVVVARNVLLLVALATVSGLLVPRAYAWVPGFLVITACWLWGTTDGVATARPWALLNAEAASRPAIEVAAGLWVVSGAWYVARDGYRTAGGSAREV